MTEVWVLETSLKCQILCRLLHFYVISLSKSNVKNVGKLNPSSRYQMVANIRLNNMCTTGHIISKYKVLK